MNFINRQRSRDILTRSSITKVSGHCAATPKVRSLEFRPWPKDTAAWSDWQLLLDPCWDERGKRSFAFPFIKQVSLLGSNVTMEEERFHKYHVLKIRYNFLSKRKDIIDKDSEWLTYTYPGSEASKARSRWVLIKEGEYVYSRVIKEDCSLFD